MFSIKQLQDMTLFCGQVFDYQNFYDTDSIFYNGESITQLFSDHFPVEFEFF